MAIKHILLVFFLGLSFSLIGQFGRTVTKHALVIGISDYQDDDIADLQYAHIDAAAFAKYLVHTSKEVREDRLTLLTNEAASGGRVHNALNTLLQNVRATDEVIIYFSGHGDVETISEKEEGHLLLYDTPSSTYQINSLRISDLRDVVNRLTTDNGASVLLVTDACRSGNLAGALVNGAQATSTALSQPFGSETKILSCQPNEFALEGAQWGGGRGLFSYHLIEGLTGLADNNNNLQVSLRELQRYLEDWVEEDAQPNAQSPMVIGSKSRIMSTVDKGSLLNLMEAKSNEGYTSDAQMSALTTKSLSMDQGTNSQLIDDFYRSISLKHLLPNKDQSDALSPDAASLFEKITQLEIPEGQLRGIRGDYIAALQDEAQQAINAYLKSDRQEIIDREVGSGNKYKQYAAYLKKAVDLLPPSNYLYNQLKAKSYYFDAVNLRIAQVPRKERLANYTRAKELVEQALLYEDRAAYILNELGILLSVEEESKAVDVWERAVALSPTWSIPLNNLANYYYEIGELDQAKNFAEKAIELKPSFEKAYCTLSKVVNEKEGLQLGVKVLNEYLTKNGPNDIVYLELGDQYLELGKKDTAALYFQKAIETLPTYIAYLKHGLANYNRNNNVAKESWQKALELNPTSSRALNNLAWLYQIEEDYREAFRLYERSIALEPLLINSRQNAGLCSYFLKNLDQSVSHFDYILKNLDDQHYLSNYYLSLIYATKEDLSLSADYLLKILSDKNAYSEIREEPLLKNVLTLEKVKKRIEELK